MSSYGLFSCCPDAPVAGNRSSRSARGRCRVRIVPRFSLYFMFPAFVVAAFCSGRSLPGPKPIAGTYDGARSGNMRAGIPIRRSMRLPDLIFRKHASRSPSAGNKSWGIIGSGNRIRFLKKRRPDNIVRTPFRYGRGGRYSVSRTATVSAVRGTFGLESTLSDSAIVLSIRWMLW